MAKAKPIPDLSADRSYAEAAARIVSVRAGELTENAQGVLDTGDIERVHDMRVATRRLRAALEIFEPCFPAEAYAEALAEVKRLALQVFNDQMPSPDRRGVASLIERLQSEQDDANRDLAPLVEEPKLAELGGTMEGLVTAERGETDA
jgi:CHAD domain-containing protein